MSRFKLTIEYEGTRYSGWQMQKGGKTIQGEILDACRELFNNEQIDIFGAGRTDGGVHASGQIAHLDVVTDLAPLKINMALMTDYHTIFALSMLKKPMRNFMQGTMQMPGVIYTR